VVDDSEPGSEQEWLRAIGLTVTACLIGTTMEWYDLLYTSLSGLIFNQRF